MKKLVLGLLAAGSTLFASSAFAAGYTNCEVTDVQYVKIGAANHTIFEACGFFWYAPTDSVGGRYVNSIIMAAELSDKRINIQCGINGGTCASFTTNVYDNNTHASRTIWSAETVNIRPNN